MKLASEYHRIEIIKGVLRPIRSASQPEATAPSKRIHKVTVRTNATAVSGTPNSCEIGTMISRNTVIKGVQGPAQPRGQPGDPLILGRLFPPRELCGLDGSGHGLSLPTR
jgi:hypothetical protein